MPHKTVKHNYFLSATLAQTFNNRFSRIDWCGNYRPSPRRTFHSSRRSGGIIRCSLLFFKGTHGLVVPPRHWYFFPTEKGLGPRGYERNEIMNAW